MEALNSSRMNARTPENSGNRVNEPYNESTKVSARITVRGPGHFSWIHNALGFFMVLDYLSGSRTLNARGPKIIFCWGYGGSFC